MRLFLIRHAEAAPLGVNGITRDEDRPLTDNGRQQARAAAVALRQVDVRLEKLLTSPLVRARQTADEMLSQWNGRLVQRQICDELAPGKKKRKLLREILALGSEEVGLVGHNPDLSELVAWFIGDKEVGIELAKGGVACISFEGPPTKEAGVLVWMVNPAWCQVVAAAR